MLTISLSMLCIVTLAACVDTYTQVSNKGSYGGQSQATQNTKDKCEAYCTSQKNCTAFDINSGNECFTHTGEGYKVTQYNGTAVNQYVRVPCAVSSK